MSCHRSVTALAVAVGLAGCGFAELDALADEPLGDDPYAYVTSTAYRRAILERDLIVIAGADGEPDGPVYAAVRLRRYANPDEPHAWDSMTESDRPTLPLSVAAAAELGADPAMPSLEFGPPLADGLGPSSLPATREEWVALGERVFFESPMALSASLIRALRDGADLRDYGVIEHEGAYVGVRFVADEGRTRLAVTCAICHASVDEDGLLSGVRANRALELGRLRLDYGDLNDDNGVDATAEADLLALGPGRSDVLADGVFNPYAFPDFGGIADMSYLHHTANWHNRGVATLAIRVETVFMVGKAGTRPSRVLMWALAEYLRSLPAPAPLHSTAAPSPASARGRLVFEAQGCVNCHAPPFYSSTERVTLAQIGTDTAAGASPVRGTGHWRVPSLRGVSGNAPYLHHGAFATLEAMFDPQRDEPGHAFGLALDDEGRADLLAFLRTL